MNLPETAPADELGQHVERLVPELRENGHSVTGDRRVTTAGAAFLLGRSSKTIRNWRYEKKGPRPQVNPTTGVVTYLIRDVIEWERAQYSYAEWDAT